jgi:DNA polymerase III subunit delta
MDGIPDNSSRKCYYAFKMVVVLTGSNIYMLQKSLSDTVTEFTKKSGDSIERFDGGDMTSADTLIDAVRSISFLEPRKLVIVRDFSGCKDVAERIESIIEQTADTTELLLVDPSLDRRTTLYKYLKSKCEIRSYDPLQPHELERWLADEAKKFHINIGAQERRFLVDRVGPDQQLLFQELKKLSFCSGNITKKLIEELVEPTPQSKVFDMLDALFHGKAERAQQLYEDQRAQGEEPQKLLAMITWQLQQLTLAVFAPDKSVATLVGSGMSSYSAQKALSMSKHISKSDLRFYVTALAEVDLLSKTSADIESALEVFFSEVIQRRQR